MHKTFPRKHNFYLGPALSVLISAVFAWSQPLAAQVRMNSPVPPTIDEEELSEPGDDADGDDVFSAPSPDDQKLAHEVSILSLRERRKPLRYGGGLTVGQARPWQTYGLEVGQLLTPRSFVGAFIGSGQFDGSGTMTDKLSYKLKLESRGVGVFARYYLHNFDLLAFEGNLGISRWSGQVSALGTDASQADSSQSRSHDLTGYGMTLGFAATVSWVSEGGYFVDWTPLGLQVARLVKMDLARSEAAVNRALNHDIQGLRIYGLVNLRVGRYF